MAYLRRRHLQSGRRRNGTKPWEHSHQTTTRLRWNTLSYDVERVLTNLNNSAEKDMIEALEAANMAALRACLYQLTGSSRIRDITPAEQSISAVDRASVPPIENVQDRRLLVAAATDLLRQFRDGRTRPRLPEKKSFWEQLEVFFGHSVSETDVDYWWEEFGVETHSRVPETFRAWKKCDAPTFSVVIIGAGLSGICAAIAMKTAGIPYIVVEKNSGVGGTWFQNTYPGIRVDTPSRFYCFSFEPDYPWQHHYATGEEVCRYLNYCVDKHQVRDQIQFSTEVMAAEWCAEEQSWRIQVRRSDGSQDTVRANAVISAVGLFNRAKVPDIVGLDAFQGKVIHTAEWDSECDLRGRRVGLIGTGSSGAQIVGPISSVVGSLHIFQRSGTWIAGVSNYTAKVSKQEVWLLENVPYYLNWQRLDAVYALGDRRTALLDVDPEWTEPGSANEAHGRLRSGVLKYMMDRIGDKPELVEKSVPDYMPLTKRLPKDNGWFDALRRDNVELVTDPIEGINETGIRCRSGEQHDLDVLILATGFYTTRFLWPIKWLGKDGLTLEEAWKRDGPRAHLGMTIPGFPNLFCLYGPNTNSMGGNSFTRAELQMRYIVRLLNYAGRNGLRSIEVKKDAYTRYNDELDRKLGATIWMEPGQKSYYHNEFGRIVTNGRISMHDYYPLILRPDLDEYSIT